MKLQDNNRHSAWNSRSEAIKQAKGLQDDGLIKLWDIKYGVRTIEDFVEEDFTVECENGHYYV